MKTTHPYVASLLFDRPLMIHRAKLDTIIKGIAPRLGLSSYQVAPPAPPAARPPMASQGGISVIQVFGSLVKRACGMEAESGLTTYTDLEAEITDAATDPSVSAILLDVGSDGGECGGAFDLSDLIYNVRAMKPVYAIANDNALSAGYLLASSAERLFMTQTSLTGSIGVVAVHCDESEANAEEGLKYTVVTYGDHKADFSALSPLSDSALQWLTNDVNRLGEMFVASVARNRNISPDLVRATRAGLYSSAKNGTMPSAIEAGLADEIGTRADAIVALQDRLAGRKRIAPSYASSGRLASAPLPEAAPILELPASASAAAISPTQEANMADLNVADANNKGNPPEVAPPQPVAAVPIVPAAAAVLIQGIAAPAPTGMNASQIRELNDLCLIAGTPHALASFLSRDLTFDAAKAELMKARAEAAGPEIQSQVLPDAGTRSAANSPNRLVESAKKLSMKKYGKVNN